MVFVELARAQRGLPLVCKRQNLHVAHASGRGALDPVTHPDQVARTNRNTVELDVSPRASNLAERARLVQARGAEPSIDANGFRWLRVQGYLHVQAGRRQQCARSSSSM